MNTFSTIHRCTQLTLLFGAVGWILLQHVHPSVFPCTPGTAEFFIMMFCVGLVPVATVAIPTLYDDSRVRRTAVWFALIGATALFTLATILQLKLAAISAVGCVLTLGIFYLGKHFVLKALQAPQAH